MINITALDAIEIHSKSIVRKKEVINELERIIRKSATVTRDIDYSFTNCSGKMQSDIINMLRDNGFKIHIKADRSIRISF